MSLHSPVNTLFECKALTLKVAFSDFAVAVAMHMGNQRCEAPIWHDCRAVFLLSSGCTVCWLLCYGPGARDQARKKTITFFAWNLKQAASQISFSISNEIGVYRHQLHIRDTRRLIWLLIRRHDWLGLQRAKGWDDHNDSPFPNNIVIMTCEHHAPASIMIAGIQPCLGYS